MSHEIRDPMLKAIISDLKLFDMKVGDLLKMHTNIGMHIMKEDILNEILVNKSGFCGGVTCSNRSEVSTSKGKQLPV